MFGYINLAEPACLLTDEPTRERALPSLMGTLEIFFGNFSHVLWSYPLAPVVSATAVGLNNYSRLVQGVESQGYPVGIRLPLECALPQSITQHWAETLLEPLLQG